MSAKNTTNSSKTNYYGVAFGYLSTNQKEFPEGKEETTTAKLKAKMQNHENLDLRNAYVKKDGDYPYQVFYQTIGGVITSIEKKEDEKYGVQLVITMIDEDHEISIIQTKFYSKYVENLLNRLIGVKTRKFSLSPYSIPSDYENRKFYNQGIVVYENKEKLIPIIKNEDLPELEEIENAEGKKSFSRVKRINSLFDQAIKNWNQILLLDTSSVENSPITDFEEEDDDLPF